MRPTQKELLAALDYNPATGAIVWRAGKRRGKCAGHTKRDDGYVQIEFAGRAYYAHRLIWCLQTGEWPADEIDHINHVRHDNRWSNLRELTRAQNAAHRKRKPNYGISKLRGKFQVRLGGIYIGLYDTIEEAREAQGRAKQL